MNLKISRILHAGYIFECGNTRIAFDPIFENPFSTNCYAFPPVQFDHNKIRSLKLDAVFISHFHDDHCSMESLNYLDRTTPIYMYYQFEELFSLIKELGFTEVHSLQLNSTITMGKFEVIPRQALDVEVDSIFHIKAAGFNILNVVDSWIDPVTMDLLAQTKSWDLILWPFQTMRELEVIAPDRATPANLEIPTEWIEQLQILKPRYLIPSSCQFKLEPWSWYNQAFFPISYGLFTKQIKNILETIDIFRLDPGKSLTLENSSIEKSTPLDWVIPVDQKNDEQTWDYDYNPPMTPPSTSEIAKHFVALSAEQTKAVLDFCSYGLIQKYNSLDAPLDEFFNTPRLWKLSVVDHLSHTQNFYYTVHCGKMNSSASNGLISWTTEVPIAKLFAALHLGESLTSMYLRIIGSQFEDIVEDPLIRCLFSNCLGSYQRAQLAKIKK